MDVGIVLLVSHLMGDGTWYHAPPADMETMQECKEAKKETEAGLRGDAIDEFKVRCKRRSEVDDRPKTNDTE